MTMARRAKYTTPWMEEVGLRLERQPREVFCNTNQKLAQSKFYTLNLSSATSSLPTCSASAFATSSNLGRRDDAIHAQHA